MKTFLEYVAEDLYHKAEEQWHLPLARITVVFPNKRASLFLDDHLARLAQRPIWSPHYCSISELFSQKSHLHTADPLLLVGRLWRTWCRVTGSDETLDEFFGWGQMLLADFDDVDSQLVDAHRLFANLRDLHELDDLSFLSPTQVEALRQFFAHLQQDPVSQLRQRFLRVWSRLADVYDAFRADLERDGLAYEGMLSRQVVESKAATADEGFYVFVGFNALLTTERQLMRQLKDEGRARFYWDYDRYFMQAGNEAGLFVSQWLELFPNELTSHPVRTDIYDRFRQKKDISIVSAQTEDIQGRYVGRWLADDGQRLADGRLTAVVMCNEQLLSSVMHQLPKAPASVNITTGYPLLATPVASLLQVLADLRTQGWRGPSKTPEYQYRHRWLQQVLRHPLIAPLAETADMRHLLLTRPTDLPQTQEAQDTVGWMTRVVEMVARQRDTSQQEGDGFAILTTEALFRAYTLLQRLSTLMEQGELPIDLPTLPRLLRQLAATTTIPFNGEPAEGLQVMGMLETRCLDFSHVLLLSASEGQLPRGVTQQSFVPYTLRKAYGLTTPDDRVAVYSYHFHHLLARATDVTLCYNNATNDTAKGEMSRYLMQLLVEDEHHHPRLLTMQPSLGFTPFRPRPREKTPDVMHTLAERFAQQLSPTALSRYLRCPLIFYYNYVEGITETDDDEDESAMNQRDFGNVFHEAAQLLYEPFAQQGRPVTAEALDHMLADMSLAERLVDEAFARSMQHRHGAYSGLQIISREVIIALLRRLMQLDRRLTPFSIVGLETEVLRPLHIATDALTIDTQIGGRIDRLDMVSRETPGTPQGCERLLRVVDYKTGSAKLTGLPSVADVFDPGQLARHNDYYLQALLYADIVAGDEKIRVRLRDSGSDTLPVSPALLFIQHAAAADYDPTLVIDKVAVTDSRQLHTPFNELLDRLIQEIFSTDRPFTPTPQSERCLNCPYRQLCSK